MTREKTLIETNFTSEMGLNYIYDLCYIQYVKEIVLIMIILIMAISIRFTGADPFFLCVLSFFYISMVYINHLDPNCF